MKGWGGVGGVGGHVNVPCASSATCCYADFVWVGNPQARWVWKNILPWNGENQLPNWNNRCRMECCQRLHPQLVVFEGQRSSPLCEVLAVEMCESAYPSPAKTNFNAEAPALERKKKPVNTPQWHESQTHTKREFGQILAWEFGTIRLAEMSVSLWQKNDLLEKRCFYEHGFWSAGTIML